MSGQATRHSPSAKGVVRLGGTAIAQSSPYDFTIVAHQLYLRLEVSTQHKYLFNITHHIVESSAGFPSPKKPRKALEAPEIARLFAHYIAELAPWYDLSDASARFGIEVPETALQTPLLFSAIIALSAMHASCTRAQGARSTAEFYHGCCVRMLIAIEDDNVLLQQGVALAATCLLRSYEILDGRP